VNGKEGAAERQLIYYHALGKDPAKDEYLFGKELPPQADTTLSMSPKDRYVLASVTAGWANDQFAHYLIEADGKAKGKAKRIGSADDKITSVSFGQDDDLYLHCWRDAPRGKIVRVPLDRPALKNADTIVPESKAVIQGFVLLEKALLVQDRVDGAARVRVFTLEGKEKKPVPIPADSHVAEVVPLEDNEVLFSIQSYLTPPAWYT